MAEKTTKNVGKDEMSMAKDTVKDRKVLPMIEPDLETIDGRALKTCALIVSGETVVDALKSSGRFPESVEIGIQTAGIVPYKPRNALARALQALGVTPEFLAGKIKEGCEATKPVIGRDAEGNASIIGEIPDHKTRFPFIELSAKARGDIAEELNSGEESYELRVLKYRRQA